MDGHPLLSIVIANYNYGRYIANALDSVIRQCSEPVSEDGRCVLPIKGVENAAVELIVVDGGSTDESVEVIRKYEKSIAWWCSEKDRGQSHAFNKGFAQARGKYLTWLNADDVMFPNAIRSIVSRMIETDADWLSGNLIRFDSATQKITGVYWGPIYLPAWMQGNGWPVSVYGPTSFWKKGIWEKLGGIDESCFFAMDTEFWIKMYMNGYKQVRVNAYCWAFGMHEESKTAEFGSHKHSGSLLQRKNSETARIASQNGYSCSSWKTLAYRLWRILDFSYLYAFIMRLRYSGKSIKDFAMPMGDS